MKDRRRRARELWCNTENKTSDWTFVISTGQRPAGSGDSVCTIFVRVRASSHTAAKRDPTFILVGYYEHNCGIKNI